MATQDHTGVSLARNPLNEFQKLLLTPRIQSEGRFIQEDNGWIINKSTGNAKSLSHAAAVCANQRFCSLLKPHFFEEYQRSRFRSGGRLSVELTEVHQEVQSRDLLGKTKTLRENADPGPNFLW